MDKHIHQWFEVWREGPESAGFQCKPCGHRYIETSGDPAYEGNDGFAEEWEKAIAKAEG